jgi:hypothetical protein
MPAKQVHFSGYIDVPDGFQFPDIDDLIDARLNLSAVILQVKGDKTMKNKTSGEASARKYTLETVVVSAKWNGKFMPAEADPDQPELS